MKFRNLYISHSSSIFLVSIIQFKISILFTVHYSVFAHSSNTIMASASPLFLLPLFLLLITLCIPCSSSISSQSQSQMLLLTLTHSLSQSNTTTTHHLLRTTTTRSFNRFRRRHHHHHHRNNPQLSLPLSPGSDYTLSFTISSHPITLYMDTGSDLVWFPCSPFTCILCDLNNNPTTTTTTPSLPKIPQNNTVPCHSPSCSAAHSSTLSLSSSDLCAISYCPLDQIETNDCSSFKCPPFYYAYGDGSLIATLYKHTISLSSSLHLKNFTFGCAHTTLNEPVGVAGFGRGLLSLPAQIATFAPQLGNRFSYCLVSHSFDSERIKRPSPLILGRYDDKQRNNNGNGGEVDDEFVYTPMLENHKHPYFYSVGLVAISVGKRVIPAPQMLRRVDTKGNGGVVVDSGTTFTMLPAGFYDSVVAEFVRRVGRVRERASRVESNTGLKPCYYLDGGEKREGVPALTLHFGRGNYSSVTLPRRNYFYQFLDGGDEGVGQKRSVGCLMLMNGGDDAELSGGPGATLGNYQQQGFEVVYDLENKRVGFARRQCASLWEKLSLDNN